MYTIFPNPYSLIPNPSCYPKGLEKEMNIKIVVATHKPYPMPGGPMYLPVQGGAACHERMACQGDDAGENISEKNGVYCEMTALYWAWKNLDADALGLCHYRRYFREPGKNEPAREETLQRLLNETPVILPEKRNYYIETGESQFVHAHGRESLDALRGALNDLYPAYLPAFDRSMGRTAGHRFNMMIMRRKELDAYCAWLFSILFETEKRLNPPAPRMMGYLAERLLDAWIETENMPYKELKVYRTEKENWLVKGGGFLLRKIRGSKT